MQNVNRSHQGVFETAAAWPCPHSQGRRGGGSFGGCADEPRRCSCWAAAWEENTLCKAGEQQKKKGQQMELELTFIPVINTVCVCSLFPPTQKTHRGLCWFDFLEMLGHLFFAAKLSLALRTFITDELQCLCFLLGYRLMWLGFCVWSGLAF